MLVAMLPAEALAVGSDASEDELAVVKSDSVDSVPQQENEAVVLFTEITAGAKTPVAQGPKAVASINVGDYIKLGTYYGKPIIWRCVSIDENGPLMLSDKILCLKAFDAAYGGYTNSYRKSTGSNYWKTSTIRQWLNSRENVVTYSLATPNSKNVYNGYNAYNTEPGFLTNFTEDELSYIKPVTQKTYLNSLDSGLAEGGNKEYDIGQVSFSSAFSSIDSKLSNRWYNTSEDSIFLLGPEQAAAVYKNLGSDYLMANPTPQAVLNSDMVSSGFNKDSYWQYWLRLPMNTGMSYENVSVIGTNGNTSNSGAFGRGASSYPGIRPAFYLNGTPPDFEHEKPQNPVVIPGVIQSATISRGGKTVNILTTRQSFEKGSEEQAFVTVVVDWGGAPAGKILLSQSGKKYLQTQDGNFGTIQPGKTFDSGDAIYAIAVDGNGNTLESKRVYLQVTEPVTSGDVGGDHDIKIFHPFSFTIPDDKPVLGNQSFSLDLGAVKFDLDINEQDGTFKGVIGTTIEKDDAGHMAVKEFDNIKDTVKETRIKVLKGAAASDIHNTMRKKGIRSVSSMKIKSGWEPSIDVCGYIEGRIENGTPVPTEGGIILAADLKYTYEGQAFIVVVPVYYSIGAGGKIMVTLGVKGMVPGDGYQPMFSGNLTLAPFFELGGGIGVVYLGQVGARGRATLSFNIALDQNYQKVDLTGQAYFEIKALSFTLYEREFASGTWNIYETRRSRDAGLMAMSDDTEDIYATMDLNAPVTPEDRSYADNPTVWLGEEPNISLTAADYTNKELRVLQTNAYPDAQPQIFEMDGTKVMIWLADNASRTAVNKSMLVYSVYIDAFDTWSNPEAIFDNGMADFYPVAKDGYIVWQKATKTFDTSASLVDIGKNTDIYIAKFNGTSFDNPQRLTSNDIIDTQPQIAVNGNKVTVVWTQNTENNILGFTGKNSIWQVNYDGSTWSSPASLASNLNTVAYLTVGYMGGVTVVAYALDGDNDLNTINDREIYIIRNGSTERFTNNDVLDSHPVIASINNVPALFWYSESNVYYVTDLDNAVVNTISADGINQLTDDYAILSKGNSTAILWTTVEDGGSEVHAALYDGSQWSSEVEITTTGQSARYPNGIIDDDGKFQIAFNRIQNIVDGDYYKDGQADLCVIGVTPSYDISVENAFLGDGIAPNAKVPVYFSVTNSGELPVQNVSISVMNPDGSQNGHFDFAQDIYPGETVNLEASYTTGSTVNGGNITVRISTSDGAEYNDNNNSAVISVGLCDMEVLDIQSRADGDNRVVSMRIKNAGYSDAAGVVASIHLETEIGNVVDTQDVGAMATQAEKTLEFTLDANSLATENSFITLVGMVSTTTEESSGGNNYQSFTVDKGSQSPAPSDGMAYTIDSVSVNGNKITTSITRNGTVSGGMVIMASYKSNGQMLDVVTGQIAIPSGAATGEQTMSLNTSGASYVSVYIVNDNYAPQAKMVSKSV